MTATLSMPAPARPTLSAAELTPGQYTNGCSDLESLLLEVRYVLAKRYWRNEWSSIIAVTAGAALTRELPAEAKRRLLSNYDKLLVDQVARAIEREEPVTVRRIVGLR